MVVRSLDTLDRGVCAIRTVADARAHACRHRLRYRVAIIAPSVLDAVHSVGGWVFDRVMAGWEVTVVVPDLGDPAPLRILGAIVVNLEDALGSPPDAVQIWPHELVVAATVFESDARVRAGVTANLEAHAEAIMFWGRCEEGVRNVEHRLSVAARAFKASALMLAGAPAAAVPGVETFHRRGPLGGSVADAVVIDITRRLSRRGYRESDR